MKFLLRFLFTGVCLFYTGLTVAYYMLFNTTTPITFALDHLGGKDGQYQSAEGDLVKGFRFQQFQSKSAPFGIKKIKKLDFSYPNFVQMQSDNSLVLQIDRLTISGVDIDIEKIQKKMKNLKTKTKEKSKFNYRTKAESSVTEVQLLVKNIIFKDIKVFDKSKAVEPKLNIKKISFKNLSTLISKNKGMKFKLKSTSQESNFHKFSMQAMQFSVNNKGKTSLKWRDKAILEVLPIPSIFSGIKLLAESKKDKNSSEFTLEDESKHISGLISMDKESYIHIKDLNPAKFITAPMLANMVPFENISLKLVSNYLSVPKDQMPYAKIESMGIQIGHKVFSSLYQQDDLDRSSASENNKLPFDAIELVALNPWDQDRLIVPNTLPSMMMNRKLLIKSKAPSHELALINLFINPGEERNKDLFKKHFLKINFLKQYTAQFK